MSRMINLRLSVEAFVSSKLFFPFKEYGFLLALINEEQTSLYFTSQGSHMNQILQFETFFSNNFELSQSNGKMHVYKKVFDLFAEEIKTHERRPKTTKIGWREKDDI